MVTGFVGGYSIAIGAAIIYFLAIYIYKLIKNKLNIDPFLS